MSDHGEPIRADHRFIKKVIHSMLDGKVEYVPSEIELISRVFKKAGGSWSRVFSGGSPSDIALVKDIIKMANKGGRITKKYEWGVC